VDSPRFISTLQRAIEEMFEICDATNDGRLTYQQFEDSWKTLRYGLSNLDVRIMIALADEDDDEMIPWADFVPIAVDVVRTIIKRNLTGRNNIVPPDALSIIYKAEIDKCEQLLTHDMKH
jgi:hypothetical protein